MQPQGNQAPTALPQTFDITRQQERSQHPAKPYLSALHACSSYRSSPSRSSALMPLQFAFLDSVRFPPHLTHRPSVLRFTFRLRLRNITQCVIFQPRSSCLSPATSASAVLSPTTPPARPHPPAYPARLSSAAAPQTGHRRPRIEPLCDVLAHHRARGSGQRSIARRVRGYRPPSTACAIRFA